MSVTTKHVAQDTGTEQELKALLAEMAKIQPKPTDDALLMVNDFFEKVGQVSSDACVIRLCAEKGFKDLLDLFQRELIKQAAIAPKALGIYSRNLLKIYNKTGQQKNKSATKKPKKPEANSANGGATATAAAATTPSLVPVASAFDNCTAQMSDIISLLFEKLKPAPKPAPKTGLDKKSESEAEESTLQALNSKIEKRPFLTLPEDIFSYDMELCLTFFKQDFPKLKELLGNDKFISVWNRYNAVLDEVLKDANRWANIPMRASVYEKQLKLFEAVNVFFNKVSPLIKGDEKAYVPKENLFKLKAKLVASVQRAQKSKIQIKREVGFGQRISNLVSQLVLIDTNIFNEDNVSLANVGSQVGMAVPKELLAAVAEHRKFNQLLTAVGIAECGGVKYEQGADLSDLNTKLLAKLSVIDGTISSSLQKKALGKETRMDIFAKILKSAGPGPGPGTGAGDALAQMRLTRLLLSTASENQSAMVSYVGEKDLFDLIQSVDEEVLSWNNRKDKQWAIQKKKELTDTFAVGDLGLGDMLYLYNALLYDVPLITANNAMIGQIERHPVTKYLFSCVNIIVPIGLTKAQLASFDKNPEKMKEFVLIGLDQVVRKVAEHYAPMKNIERQRARKAILNDLWSLVSTPIQKRKVTPSTDVSVALLEMIKQKYQPESLFAMTRPAKAVSVAAVAVPRTPVVAAGGSSVVLASAVSALSALQSVSLMGAGNASAPTPTPAAATAAASALQSPVSVSSAKGKPGSTETTPDDPEKALEALQQTATLVASARVVDNAAASASEMIARSFSAVVDRALQIQIKLPTEISPAQQLRWLYQGRGELSPFVLAEPVPLVPKKLALVRTQSS